MLTLTLTRHPSPVLYADDRRPVFCCCYCQQWLQQQSLLTTQPFRFILYNQVTTSLYIELMTHQQFALPSLSLSLDVLASQDSPGADPGGDVCGEDQPDPLAGCSHREPVCENQQPRAHRYPGVHRLLFVRRQGQAGVQRGYEHSY